MRMMQMNPMMGLMHFVHELPDARRDELDPLLSAFRPGSRPAFAQMRELQERFRAEILRDPVDPTKLREVLDAMQSRLREHQAASTDAFVALIQALNSDERKALDQHLQRGARSFRGRRAFGPPPDGPPEPTMAPPIPPAEQLPMTDMEIDPRSGW
jgi:Heavy-metal resistance